MKSARMWGYSVFVAALVAASFTGQSVVAQTTDTAGVSPSLSDSVKLRVDKLFAQWNKPGSPGCALGIIKDGRLIYKRGYGLANLDYNIAISPASVFEIASMVKQFTAMSILILAERGRLSLDDDIRKYLPEIPVYQSPITIRQLLHHTSGIRNHIGLVQYGGRAYSYLTDEDILEFLALQQRLNSAPGERYRYTDTAYLLLGLIVGRVSGESVHDFADQNIFKPLGMTHTTLEVDKTLPLANRAAGYSRGSNGEFSLSMPRSRGEMNTTVEDLFLWDQNFYNNKLGGGQNLIREETSRGTLNNGDSTGYAFGLDVGEYKGLRTIGHGGLGGGSSSFMIRFPAQNFSVICLCNIGGLGAHGLVNQVVDIFLAGQFTQDARTISERAPNGRDIISIPEKELDSLAGVYFDPINETRVRFYMKDGNLMIFSTALSAIGKNRFKVVGGGPPGLEIVFVRSVADRPSQVMFRLRSGQTTTYDAVRSMTLSSAQLAEFTGKYVSEELAGATYSLSVNDGHLIVHVSSGSRTFNHRGVVLAETQFSDDPYKDIVLEPAFADAFFASPEDYGDDVTVSFTRGVKNQISGFTLSAGTALTNVLFHKL